MARRLPSTTSWLRWLTPGLQIKRWLLLLMMSELVLVLGVAYALKEIYQTAHLPSSFYYITLQFLPYWARAIIFGIFGVGLLVVSYLKLTQSVLGPFLPGNSTGSVVEVIHAFRLRGRGPRIVAIGGGTGLSSLLRGLKTYTSNLSAIVTVADDGGSSGRLRDEYRIPPPGDFRQSLIALADPEPLTKQLPDHRFHEGSLYTSVLPNLLVEGMVEAIKASAALKLYVCNLAAQPGETDGYGVQDYLRVIREHVGSNLFDFVLVNSNTTHAPTGGQEAVIFRPADITRHPEVRFIASDVVNTRKPSHHDPEKLARTIMRKVWQA